MYPGQVESVPPNLALPSGIHFSKEYGRHFCISPDLTV